MNTMTRISSIAVVAGFAAHSSAGIYDPVDPGIFSPFDNAQVDVIWGYSHAGYTGRLSWVDSAFESDPQTLWTNKDATANQTYRVPRLFSMGERVDFQYQIIRGGLDKFSTADEQDWIQFEVDSSNPLDVIVGVEDIRYPRGDMDHNDAVFRVVFSEATVPSPGSLALLGAGGLFMVRRRR